MTWASDPPLPSGGSFRAPGGPSDNGLPQFRGKTPGVALEGEAMTIVDITIVGSWFVVTWVMLNRIQHQLNEIVRLLKEKR